MKAVLQLLMYFGNGHHPEWIGHEIGKLKQSGDRILDLPGIQECGKKKAEDYRKLLEAMELIVAY